MTERGTRKTSKVKRILSTSSRTRSLLSLAQLPLDRTNVASICCVREKRTRLVHILIPYFFVPLPQLSLLRSPSGNAIIKCFITQNSRHSPEGKRVQVWSEARSNPRTAGANSNAFLSPVYGRGGERRWTFLLQPSRRIRDAYNRPGLLLTVGEKAGMSWN